MELKIILVIGVVVVVGLLLSGYISGHSDRLLRKDLRVLIDRARQLGLPVADVAISADFLEHVEYGLCTDHITEQISEYSIAIDQDLYSLICRIGARMEVPRTEFDHMKELIR